MIIKDYISEEKNRFPLFFPVFLGLGIKIGVYFPFYHFSSVLFFFSTITLIMFFIFWKKRGYYIKIFCSYIFCFCIGICVVQTGGLFKTDLLVYHKFLEKQIDYLEFKGEIGFIEDKHPLMKNMKRIILKDIKFSEKYKDLNFIKVVKMTCGSRMIDEIEPNDMVEIKGRLIPFKDMPIPGSFNAKQYYSIIGINATGVVFKIKKIGHKKPFIDIDTARCKLTRAILKKIDGDAGGIAAALITGDKSAIRDEVRQEFIKAGIAHILAISGLHMTLVASIIFLVLRRSFILVSLLFTKVNPRKISAIFTIPILLLYLCVSGFSPSAIRAFVMVSIFMTSIIIGRNALSLRNVSVAALIILIIEPGSLFLVSFQLSFAAVVCLVAFYENYGNSFMKIKREGFFQKIEVYLYMSLMTTIIATIATTPYSFATFNRFSFMSLIGNILAIPLTSFIIVPFGIASLFLSSCNLVIGIFVYSLNLLISIASFVSLLPGTEIPMCFPGSIFLWSVTIGGLILCCMKTRVKYVGIILILFGIVVFMMMEDPKGIVTDKLGNKDYYLVKDGEFYITNPKKNKGRNKVIQKVSGCSGSINGLDDISGFLSDETVILPDYRNEKDQHPYK